MKGRKRHLSVDTGGLVLKAEVHSAKVMDYEGIKTLLQHAGVKRSRAFRTCVGGRRRVPGRADRGKDWVEKTRGGACTS